MAVWEYRKIYLNDIPLKTDEIDLLNDAGSDGWELVGITSNNIAYLKRRFEEPAPIQAPTAPVRVTRRKTATSGT